MTPVEISHNQGFEVLANAYFFLVSIKTSKVKYKFILHLSGILYEI